MCSIVSVVSKNSASKAGNICFPEKKLREALARQKGIKRYAFAPLDNGVYTKQEYDTFVKQHMPATAKKKTPDWNVGDSKPYTWQLVVEYEPKNDEDRAWKWLMAQPADESEYDPAEFDVCVERLKARKRDGNRLFLLGADSVAASVTEPAPDIIAGSCEEDDCGPFDPFAEAAAGVVSGLLSENPTEFQRRLLDLARENARLAEENALLKARLANIRDGIVRTLETAEDLAAC